MPHGGTRIRSLAPTDGCISYAVRNSAYRRKVFRFRGKTYKIHRAVCEAFHGAPPFAGAVVMHLDEDGLNNAPSTLRWGTQRENLNAEKFRTERCSAVRRMRAA